MRRRFGIVLSLIASAGLFAGAAESSKERGLALEPSYTALFKDGTALVVSQVELPEASGTYQVHPLPDPTLGSFWLSWPEGVELSQIKATEIRQASQVTAITIQEMLQANIGKTLWLQIQESYGENASPRLARFKIVDVPKRREDPIFWPMQERVIPPPEPPAWGQIVRLEENERTLVVPVDWVKSIQTGPQSDTPNYLVEQSKLNPVVEFRSQSRVESVTTPVSVQITFLAKGASWAPSYTVDIDDDKQATISAKAVVINDLLPMEDTAVELITGYPHIQFSGSPDAFSLVPLQQVLERIREKGDSMGRSVLANQAVLGQRFMAGAEVAMDMAAPAPSMPFTPVAGESVEDLFFYQIQDVTLKKGERGYYPLFRAEVPYEHLYTWDIPDAIGPGDYYQGIPPEQPQDVWHTLKLTNNTKTPWTTAPATTMKSDHILGQDTLNYTAPGAQTDLKITKAASVQAEQNEYEIDRQRGAATFYQGSYDRVTVKGELALTNFTDKAVRVEITKYLSGEVQEAQGEPKIQQLAQGLRVVNPRSKLVWTINVEPGKENALKLEYTYEVYVRS